MAEKEFTLKVIKSEPTPRRRRVAPGANGDAMNRVSTGSQVSVPPLRYRLFLL